jgi:hypothetical protein
MLYCFYCPQYVPFMAQTENSNHQNEVLIKFRVPRRLKLSLQERANERNITMSALLRLIASEYVKRTQ